MRIASRGSRGLFLVQAMVLMLLIVIIASMGLQLIFARSVVVGKVTSSERQRALAQSVEAEVYGCLAERALATGATVCDADCAVSSVIDGVAITSTVGGVPCQITVSVPDIQ